MSIEFLIMERLKEAMTNRDKCNKRYDGNIKADKCHENKRDYDKTDNNSFFLSF